MKLKHIAIIGSLFPILFSVVLFFGVLISADSDDENSNFSSGITGMNLSAEVLKHQPMVEKYQVPSLCLRKWKMLGCVILCLCRSR